MKLRFLSLAVLFSSLSIAQTGSPNASNIFIELGGNGVDVSLNYDRRFAEGNNGFGARLGLGLADKTRSEMVLTIPVSVNYLLGNGAHHLEAGAGVTFAIEKVDIGGSKSQSAIFFIPSLGYRLQPAHKGLTVRVFASPMIFSETMFWAGLSFGFRF
jgi:hypothetical protein